MGEQGIVALLELCFITNIEDLVKYDAHKKELSIKIAGIVERYENML